MSPPTCTRGFRSPQEGSSSRSPQSTTIKHALQAESELSEGKKREELDAAITQARVLLLRAHNIPATVADDDSRIKSLKPPYKDQLRTKAKEILIEEEVRRRTYVVSRVLVILQIDVFMQSGEDESSERRL
jgi:DnaJ family protein C protein 8